MQLNGGIVLSWDEGIKGETVREIITTDKNPLCVIAGPGTGKTFALMRRTARFLEEKSIDPSKILVITFTRITANDMVKSLSELNVNGTDNIKAITLHSFCFSTLMRRRVLEITGRNQEHYWILRKDSCLKSKKTIRFRYSVFRKGVKGI